MLDAQILKGMVFVIERYLDELSNDVHFGEVKLELCKKALNHKDYYISEIDINATDMNVIKTTLLETIDKKLEKISNAEPVVW
jgi:hypothetical protein